MKIPAIVAPSENHSFNGLTNLVSPEVFDSHDECCYKAGLVTLCIVSLDHDKTKDSCGFYEYHRMSIKNIHIIIIIMKGDTKLKLANPPIVLISIHHTSMPATPIPHITTD